MNQSRVDNRVQPLVKHWASRILISLSLSPVNWCKTWEKVSSVVFFLEAQGGGSPKRGNFSRKTGFGRPHEAINLTWVLLLQPGLTLTWGNMSLQSSRGDFSYKTALPKSMLAGVLRQNPPPPSQTRGQVFGRKSPVRLVWQGDGVLWKWGFTPESCWATAILDSDSVNPTPWQRAKLCSVAWFRLGPSTGVNVQWFLVVLEKPGLLVWSWL